MKRSILSSSCEELLFSSRYTWTFLHPGCAQLSPLPEKLPLPLLLPSLPQLSLPSVGCHFKHFFFSASSPGPAEVLMQQSQRWLSPPETCLPAHLQSLLRWKLDHEKLRSRDPVLPAAGSSPSAGGVQVRLSSSLRSQILHLFLHSLVLGLHHMANPWSLHTLFKPFSLCLAQFPRTALLPLCPPSLPTEDVGALPTALAQGLKQPNVTTTSVWPALTWTAECSAPFQALWPRCQWERILSPGL